MNNEWRSCARFTILTILVTSCVSGGFSRPDSALCIGLTDQTLFCKNSEREWIEPNITNYICTTPDSYDQLEERNNCLERELKKCYTNPKRCRASIGVCGWTSGKRKIKRKAQ